MEYEVKNKIYTNSKSDEIRLNSRLETYSLKSLDSQIFESPALCH